MSAPWTTVGVSETTSASTIGDLTRIRIWYNRVMAHYFPTDPNVGDVYASHGNTWTWNGLVWDMTSGRSRDDQPAPSPTPTVQIESEQDEADTRTLTVAAPPSLTGTKTTASAVVVSAENKSGFNALIKGTFVGTLVAEGSQDGGLTWTATAWRQTLTGAVANTLNETMMRNGSATLRGSCAGFTHYRIRLATLVSGSPQVTLITHPGVGAVFINTFVEIRSLAQYYASAAGGRVALNSMSGVVNTAVAGSPVALFENPANSGVDVYIHSIELGSNNAGRLTRSRGVPVTTRLTPRPNINRGGGTYTGKARLYAGGNTAPQFVATPPAVSGKTTFISANSQDHDEVEGSIILRPGENLYWFYDADSRLAAVASVEVVWWEAATTI